MVLFLTGEFKVNEEELGREILKNPERIAQMEFDKLLMLLECAKNLFVQEPYLLKLKNTQNLRPNIIIGDIHGNLSSLNKIIDLIDELNPEFIVSLGDIVDRGPLQLECLMTVISLKIVYPNKFYWLKGNHETEEMNRQYGFFDFFIKKVGQENQFHHILDIYDELPYCAVLNDQFLCVHGGLAKDVEILQKLKQIDDGILKKETYNSLEDSLFQLMWNDPKEGLSGFKESFRGPGIYYFGKDVVDTYLEKYGIKCIIRAHECFPEGFRWFFEGKLLSIFSAADYRGAKYNPASYAIVKGDQIIPKTFFS